MDWILTYLDTASVAIWCTLNSEIGKPVLGFVGGSGLLAVIKSLWTLPPVTAEIITIRNQRRTYRGWTIFLGWLVLCALVLCIIMYSVSVNLLLPLGKVCELSPTPDTVARKLLPFFGAVILVAIIISWFQARVDKIRNF
jgi:hypothetical protein